MAMEIHVFFRGKLPSKAALGKTMKELDFPLSLKPATGPLEGQYADAAAARGDRGRVRRV
jgi:hypothetical protein